MKIEGGIGPWRQSFAGAPRAHQLAHQPPLRAAGVLELVDEHVLVARLQAIAAARELLHLAKQLQRALEQIGKVEHAVLVERPAVFVLRDREQPPHAARQHHVDVALERRRPPPARAGRGRRRSTLCRS